MFDRLRKVFKRLPPFVQVNTPPPDHADNPDYVTDPVRILRILKILQKHHVLLTVRIPGVHRPFVSSLLEVEEAHNLIILDELNPVRGHLFATERKCFKIEALLRGVIVSFPIANFSVAEENGIALYKASLPNEVYYPQRRKSDRISLESTINIPFECTTADKNTPIHGSLANLSLGGLAFFIPLSDVFTSGDVLQDCKITLPNGEEVQFMLSVRYVKSLRQEDRMIIGGCFSAIGYEDCKNIEQFLGSHERHRIKT